MPHGLSIHGRAAICVTAGYAPQAGRDCLLVIIAVFRRLVPNGHHNGRRWLPPDAGGRLRGIRRSSLVISAIPAGRGNATACSAISGHLVIQPTRGEMRGRGSAIATAPSPTSREPSLYRGARVAIGARARAESCKRPMLTGR